MCGVLGGEPSVRAVGMQVVFDKGEEGNAFIGFWEKKALCLVMVLDGGGAKLPKIDATAIELDSLTDDTGKDLSGKLAKSVQVSNDGTFLEFKITGADLPAPGARWVCARGMVKKVAGAVETKSSPVVSLEVGARVKVAGNLEFEVQGMGKPARGDQPFEVALGIDRKVPEVVEIRFFDKAGKLIESRPDGEKHLELLGKVRVTKRFVLAQAVDELRIEVDIGDGKEGSGLSFNVNANLGGAKHDGGS